MIFSIPSFSVFAGIIMSLTYGMATPLEVRSLKIAIIAEIRSANWRARKEPEETGIVHCV